MIYKKISLASEKFAAELSTWKINSQSGNYKDNQKLLIDVYTRSQQNQATGSFEFLVFTDQADIAPNGLFLQEISSALGQTPNHLRDTLLHTVRSSNYVYASHQTLVSGMQALTKFPIKYPELLDNLLLLDKSCKMLSKQVGYTSADSMKATSFKKEVHDFMIKFAQTHEGLKAKDLEKTFCSAFDSKKWTNQNSHADLSQVRSYALKLYTQMMSTTISGFASDDEEV